MAAWESAFEMSSSPRMGRGQSCLDALLRPAKVHGMARPPKPKKPAQTEPTEPSTDLAPVVGKNLKRLRTERGLSLERLAQSSGVSRAMLGQVELGQSAPTINVLWKSVSCPHPGDPPGRAPSPRCCTFSCRCNAIRIEK